MTTADFDQSTAELRGFGTWTTQLSTTSTFYLQLFDGFGNKWNPSLCSATTEAAEESEESEAEPSPSSEEADPLEESEGTEDDASQTEELDPCWEEFQERLSLSLRGREGLSFEWGVTLGDGGLIGIHYFVHLKEGAVAVVSDRIQLALSIDGAPAGDVLDVEVHAGDRRLPLPPLSWQITSGPCPTMLDGVGCPPRPQSERPAVVIGEKGVVELAWSPEQSRGQRMQVTAQGQFFAPQSGRFLLTCTGDVQEYSLNNSPEQFVGGIW